MTRAKNRKCPKCGQMFSGQGLAGHLRWVHQLDAATIRDVLDGVPLPPPAPPKPAPAPQGSQGKEQGAGGLEGSGAAAAILVAGLAILAIILAKQQEGRDLKAKEQQPPRDLAYCARCKQELDIAEARRKRVSVVQCPKCGQLNALPPLNGGAQSTPQQQGQVAGAPYAV